MTPATSCTISASYSEASSWTQLPTFWEDGILQMSIKNTGTCTWTPSSFFLGEHIFKSNPGSNPCNPVAGSIYNYIGLLEVPATNIAPGQTWTVAASTPELPKGTFTIAFDMARNDVSTGGNNYWFSCSYGVPTPTASQLVIPHYAPIITLNDPAPYVTVGTNRPQFDIWVQSDATAAVNAEVNVCPTSGTCLDSGWQSVSITAGSFASSFVWTAPANDLVWDASYAWKARAQDSSSTLAWSGAVPFTIVVPQPSGAGFFGVGGEGVDAAGVGLYVGNFTQQLTDLALPTVGIPLRLQRTYNSANSASGAFGSGWTSLVDMHWVQDSSTGIVTVTYADGKQVAYAQNPDGTWSAGYGQATADLYPLGGDNCVHLPGGRYYCFGPNGRLDWIADPAAPTDQVNFSYDGSGHAIQISDLQSSRSLYLTWTGSAVTSVSDAPAGASGALVWTYAYTSGRLTSVCDANGSSECTHYSYGYTDATHTVPRLDFIAPPSGRAWASITYSGDNVATIQRPDGTTGSTTPATSDPKWIYTQISETSGDPLDVLTVEVQDPNGVKTWNAFDTQGDLTQRNIGPTKWGAAQPDRVWSYDFQGRLQSASDENFNVTEYYYDAISGEINTLTTYRGNVSVSKTYQYDNYGQTDAHGNMLPATGLVLTAKDANQHVTTYSYSSAKDLLTITTAPTAALPNGATTTNTYTCQNGAAAPAVVNDPSAPAGATQPCHLLASTTDGNGAVTTYGYDHFGDRTQEQTPAGQVTNWYFDANAMVTKKVVTDPQHPSGVEVDYTHDGTGRVLTETDPVVTNPVTGVTHQRVITNHYDIDGNLTETLTSDATGHDTTRDVLYGCDKADRRNSETDNGVLVSSSVFDGLGRQSDSTTATGGHYHFAYDAEGDLTSATLKGFVDVPDQNTTPRDVRVHYYTYDAGGRMASQIDALGHEVDFTYTTDNLLATEKLVNYKDPTGTVAPITLHSYAYDNAGNVVSDTQGNSGDARTTTTSYDADNNPLIVTVDPSGLNRATTYTYDATGRISSTALSDGTRTETSQTAYGPQGVAKTLVHNDATPDLITQYTRAANGAVLTSTDPRGASSWTSTTPGDPAYTTTNTYDLLGRLSTTTLPATPTEDGSGSGPANQTATSTRGYDTFGDLTDVKDPRGNVTHYGYDTSGRKISVTYPSYSANGTPVPATESWTYDAAGNALTHTDRLGQTTQFEYDARNRLVRVITPPASSGGTAGTARISYDDNNNALSTVDPTGAQVLQTFDAMDRPVTRDQYDRVPSVTHDLTSFTYDDFGDVVKQATADLTTTATYDNAGELTSTTTTGLGTTTYQYDLAGRLIKTTDAMGRAVLTTEDLAGRPTKVTRLDSTGATVGSTNYTTDPAGNVTAAMDPNGNIWHLVYDARNHVTSLTDPPPSTATGAVLPAPVTSFGYDSAGNKSRVTDANGNVTYTGYNSWNLPSSVVEPATPAAPAAADGTTTLLYNAAGEETTRDLPGGVAVASSYDLLGRLTGQTGSGADGATTARSYQYDLDGRLTRIAAHGGTDTYSYDDRGLIVNTNEAWNGASSGVNYATTYDTDGRVSTTANNPGGGQANVTTYTYSGPQQLASLTDTLGGESHSYTYNTAGQLSGEKLVNSAGGTESTRSYGYDTAGRLTSDTSYNATGTALLGIQYGYDPNGNLTNKTTTGPLPSSMQYTYDADNRLVRAADISTDTTHDSQAQTGTDYTWDSAGNRTGQTQWTGNGSPTTTTSTATASYDSRNELLTATAGATTTSYNWTARGTLAAQTTTSPGSTLTTSSAFDAFGQQVTRGAEQYSYDSLGRLSSIANTDPNIETQDLDYDKLGTEPIVSANADGATAYVRAPNGQIVASGSTNLGSLTNLIRDAHGDVIAGGAAALSARRYDPFGNQIAQTTYGVSTLGFQGGYTDTTTGQVYAESRWYSPATGTFASTDQTLNTPISNAASLNTFTYANDNPTTNNDPTGRFSIGGFFSDLGSDLGDAASSVGDALGSAASSVGDALGSAASSVGTELADFASSAGEALASGIVDVAEGIGEAAPILEEVAAGVGEAFACVELCAALIVGAVVVVVVAGVVYEGTVASGGKVTINTQTACPINGCTSPKPVGSGAGAGAGDGSGQPASNIPPVNPPKPQPPVVTGTATQTVSHSWSTQAKWYNDGFLYTRTDHYTYNKTQSWIYYSDGSWTTHWTSSASHTWTILATPVINLANPTIVRETKPAKPFTPFVTNTQGTPNGTCGNGGNTNTCLTRDGSPLPPDAQPEAGSGGGGIQGPPPPSAPASGSCEPGDSTSDPAGRRVGLWQSTKQAIQDAAPRTASGDFIDPNTGTVIPAGGPFDYGHLPGFEWWRTQVIARAGGWTRQQVISYENDPSHYQIEDPSANRSHRYEMPPC